MSGIMCDCVEFNGHIVYIPVLSKESQIKESEEQADLEAFVFASDIVEAIELLIQKAKFMIAGKRNVRIQEEESSWMLLEFPFCPHVKMEYLSSDTEKAIPALPFCSFPEQNTACAIIIPDGRCEETKVPMACPVCAMFKAYYEDDHSKREIKLTQKIFRGVNYITAAD